MDITGIRRFVGILLVGIIIDLADLVATVQNRNAGLHEHVGVEHQIHPHRPFHSRLILLEPGFLDPAHGSGGAAESGVTRDRIRIVQLTPAGAVPGIPLEIIVQILFVGTLPEPFRLQRAVVKPPADIIMTAQIIEEHILFGQPVDNVQLTL